VPFGKETKEPFFSNTWDEFDQMRNQMMQKNHGFWDKVDHDMKEFEACVSQMEADMDASNAHLRPALPGWALPESHRKDWPMIANGEHCCCSDHHRRGGRCLYESHFSEGSSSSSGRSDCEVVKVATTENKWEVELDVAKFKPEDLKVEKA
jgi:hypothetical protein